MNALAQSQCAGKNFTANLAERKRSLFVNSIDEPRNAVRKMLTNHLHTVWILPEGDADFSTRWALNKVGFSRCIPVEEQRSRADKRGEVDQATPLQIKPDP